MCIRDSIIRYLESKLLSESYIKPLECCFTLKWFHVIIILVKNFDDRKPFLIVRCNEWGEFLIQRVCVFQRSIIW